MANPASNTIDSSSMRSISKIVKHSAKYSAYVSCIFADSEHTFLLEVPIQGNSSKAGLTHDINNTNKHDGKPVATTG